MKKFYKLTLLLGVLFCASTMYAQNISDMRLNEVLVTNTEGFEDDYGYRSGWVELFNTSYGTVNIAGCYLSTDPNNLTMYRIPKGDVLTSIPPRQHILFWADGVKERGTFHVNFKLDDAKEVLFVSTDGKTIVDRVAIPQLDTNQSYARKVDGEGSVKQESIIYKSLYKNMVAKANANDTETVEGWIKTNVPTPSTNNLTLDGESKGALMKEVDPYGLFLTFTAMFVTFLSLIILYVIFKNIGKFHIKKKSENAVKAMEGTGKSDKADTSGQVSAETYAAISMAIHLFMQDNEAHDFEDTVLTINKVSRTYSPWSSKIYTLRETPQLKK
ncbi:MAG: OadG family protein [Bacteroidales bacterium]|nr:OadG family protein [Bacteroidales bacterium]